MNQYAREIRLAEIDEVRMPRLAALDREFWKPWHEIESRLPEFAERPDVDLSSDAVRIGRTEDLSPAGHEVVARAIEALVPWRKGPFELFGRRIDAEWRSDLKWVRIAPHLGPLDGKRIADIGCSNGYYLFRLFGEAQRRGEEPECCIGCDPSERFFLAFRLFQRYLREPRLSFELLGVEQAPLFPEFFDLVLCFGVIYHQRDPLGTLEHLRRCMRPGARLILESQAIPGDEPHLLFPRPRYAKARNVYFVPTASALAALAERAGFSDVEIVSMTPVTPDEQRRTELAPYESLNDFLDPSDSTKTVEGYPAPWRAVVVARRPR